ncbi:hypothetical protein ACFQ1S_09345, partial [Kibdelosporangium lantanae]
TSPGDTSPTGGGTFGVRDGNSNRNGDSGGGGGTPNPCASEQPTRAREYNGQAPPGSGPTSSPVLPGSFPIRIDATQLMYRVFIIPGVTQQVDSRVVQTINLRPGNYGIQVQSGRYTSFGFRVTPAGRVDYDPKFDSFVSGRNDSTLTISGVPVTIDVSNLSGSGVIFANMPQTHADWIVRRQVRMVPQPGYTVQQGSGEVAAGGFNVELDGRVTYPAALDVTNGGFLRGNGTPTIEFVGYPLCIDARAMGAGSLTLDPIWGIPVSRTRLQQVNLLPAQFFNMYVGGARSSLQFTLAADGTFSYPSSEAGNLSLTRSNGLAVLTVLKPP